MFSDIFPQKSVRKRKEAFFRRKGVFQISLKDKYNGSIME